MYVYGGVTLHVQTNKRVPADSEAGLVHAFDFSTYTWSTLRTTGETSFRTRSWVSAHSLPPPWDAGAVQAMLSGARSPLHCITVHAVVAVSFAYCLALGVLPKPDAGWACS